MVFITRGQRLVLPLALSQNAVEVTGTAPNGTETFFTLGASHCFEVGDAVVFSVSQTNCANTPQCGTVTFVDANLISVDGVSLAGGTAPGYIGKALDMEGLGLMAKLVRRKDEAVRPLPGALFSGVLDNPNFLVVKGSTDFRPGDLITVSAGVISQEIKAVWGDGRNGELLLEFHMPVVAANFFDSPGIRAGVNNPRIKVEQPDPDCGFAYLIMEGTQTSLLHYPGLAEGCCNEAVLIGCFQVCLVQGHLHTVPDHYPAASYASQVSILFEDEAYLFPGVAI